MFSAPPNTLRTAFGGVEFRLLPRNRVNQRLAHVFDSAKALKHDLDAFTTLLKDKKQLVPPPVWNALNSQRASLTTRYRLLMDSIVELGRNKPRDRLARMWFAPSIKKRANALHADIRDLKHTLSDLVTRLTVLSATENLKYQLNRLVSHTSRDGARSSEHRDDAATLHSATASKQRLTSSLHDLFSFKDQSQSNPGRSSDSLASPRKGDVHPLQIDPKSSVELPEQSSVTSETSSTSNAPRAHQPCYCARYTELNPVSVTLSDAKPESIEIQTKTAVLSATQDGRHFLALQGLPGTGKSAVMHALRHDDDITAHFSDGVVWLSLRSGVPDLGDAISTLAEVVRLTGGKAEAKDIANMTDIEAAVERAAKSLADKRLLLLLDKSWTAGDVGFGLVFKLRPLIASESGTVVTFITEDSQAIWEARRINFAPREPLGEESLYIFLNYAGFTKEELLDSDTVENLRVLLLSCNGLPQALTIAGKSIAYLAKSGASRKHSMQLYVEQHDGLTDDDMDHSACISDIVGYQVQATLLVLEQTHDCMLPSGVSFHDLFLALGVVEKGRTVPLEMLRHLWQLSPGITRTVSSMFDETGIVHLLSECHQSVEEIQIHDLVQDYACSEMTMVDFTTLHAQLVTSYSSLLEDETHGSDECREWWTLSPPDGGYFTRNFVRHLYHSGHRSEMLKLVVKPQWIVAQLQKAGADQVDNDIGFVTDFLTFNNSLDAQSPEALIVDDYERIGAAARQSAAAIGNDSKEISFRLYDRLLAAEKSGSNLSTYLRDVERSASGPWLKPLQPCLGSYNTSLRSVMRILSQPNCMVTLAGENYVACGCTDGQIVMVDTRRKRVVGQWRAHSESIVCMCRSSNGKVLVTGSRDTTIKVWDCASSTQIDEVPLTDQQKVACLGISHDEQFVIAGFHDGSLLVWDLDSGERVAEAFNIRSPSAFTHIEVLPGEERLVTASEDGILRMWILETSVNANEDLVLHLKEDKNWSAEHFSNGVDSMCVHAESHMVAAASDSCIRITDLRNGSTMSFCEISRNLGRITNMGFDANGKCIVLGSSDRAVHVLDVEMNRIMGKPLRGHARGISGVAFLSGGNRIISSAADETLRIWEFDDRHGADVPGDHTETVSCLAIARDSNLVVSGSWDATLRIWDMSTGKQISAPLTGHRHKVSAVSVSADGKHIISGAYDGSIRVWTDSGLGHKILGIFKGHSDWVSSVAISPAGDTAVSASFDGTVKIWDLQISDGRYVALRGQKGWVRMVEITADGERVITASRHEVRVWSLASGNCIRKAEHPNVAFLSKQMMFRTVEEETDDETVQQTFICKGFQVRCGNDVLATLPSSIECFKYAGSNGTLCAGLLNGQVAFFKLQL